MNYKTTLYKISLISIFWQLPFLKCHFDFNDIDILIFILA
jgi:hypothetical protein